MNNEHRVELTIGFLRTLSREGELVQKTWSVRKWEFLEAHPGPAGHPAELTLWLAEDLEKIANGVTHNRVQIPLSSIAWIEVLVYNGPAERRIRVTNE